MGNVEPSDQDRSDLGNGAPRDSDGPAHASGSPAQDDRWLRSVVEHSSEIVTIVDLDGTLRYANPAWARALGFDPAEAVGTMNVLDHVHPEDLAHVLKETEEALAKGGVVTNEAEYRFRHRGGSWRWLESLSTYLLDDPHVEGVVVVSRDLTERKEAETRLREAEGKYRTLVDQIPVVTYIDRIDETSSALYMSPQVKGMLGYTPEEWLEDPELWIKVLHPHDRERILGEAQRTNETGDPFRVEYRVVSKRGHVLCVRDEAVLVRDAQGAPSFWQGILYDVTERKEAEEKYRTLIEQMPAVTYVEEVGEAHSTLYMSPQVEDLLGYPPEDWLGGVDHWKRCLHSEDRERVLAENARSDETGEPFRVEYRMVHRDGRAVWVHDEAVLVEDPVGRSRFWQGVITDVTERAQAEDRLREAEERYRTLVEQVPAMTYRHRQVPGEFSGTSYVSPQVETVLGYTQEEYTSDPEFWQTILHPDDRERVLTTVESTGESGEPFDLEFRMIAKDGRAVWFRESGTLVRDEDGWGQIWHGVMVDITGLKRTEGELREAENRYRTLVEQIPAVTYIDRVTNGPDEPLYTSPQIEQMLGYTPEEWLEGRLWPKRLHPDDRERVLAADERFEKEWQERFGEEYRLIAKDGSVVWVSEEAVLVRNEAGKPMFWQGIMHDVTERREAEEALRRSEASLAESQRMAHLGTWEWNVAAGEVWWSDEAYRIHGLELTEGMDLRAKVEEAFFPEDLPRDRRKIDEALSGEADGYDHEHRIRRPDGQVRWVHGQAEVVRGESGEPLRMIGTVHDVTERKALEDRLRYQAYYDALTGLPNRQLFLDRLGRALARTRRSRDRRVALLFMDLDGFKVVNDSLGHQVGDLLLVAVAERLKGCLRPEDTLARFGGDEFVVLVEDVEAADEAVRVAERIIDELKNRFVLDRRELYARTSIGIAIGEDRTKDPDDLLRDADTAMYRAKDEGSGYEVFDLTMHDGAVDRLELENDLRRAIEEDEFVVHYQPIVNLQTGELWGFEALVRWEHPERGLLDPDEFVPVAEESGLVVPMGEMVLGEACRRAAEWQEEHPLSPPLAMSVNLSSRQLRRPDLPEIVERVLAETGLPASSLGLDITETVYISALDANTAALDRLKALGIRISLDDFGSGYSSLSYLKRLPADILKVDRSFTKGLGLEVEDTAIVQTIVDLAHILGMEVVAEGVEIEAQETLLKVMGCDKAQGFHFARPLPPEGVPEFLND